MRILSITAGAADMYCGSCLRDNALATELLRRGHDVVLMPVYTPTLTDEPNVSQTKILFGGISVYLEQNVPLFRHTPRFVDRLWDRPWALKLAAKRSIKTDPRWLGEMTVSMLEAEHGHQAKEFAKLVDWLRSVPPPDVVMLPNVLLSGFASSIKRALGRPVVCTMQGEDLFLEGLGAGHRRAALGLIRQHAESVDVFVAVSEFYGRAMPDYLGIPPGKVRVVPLGINPDGFSPAAERPARPFTVGYMARVAPEKGLHLLAEAYKTSRTSPRSNGRWARGASPANSAITASSIGRRRSRFSRASTCSRCRRPTTSPRDCRSSRRWRAACPSSSRGAARSLRSSSAQAAACSSSRTMRRRSRRASRCWPPTRPARASSAAAVARACSRTTTCR